MFTNRTIDLVLFTEKNILSNEVLFLNFVQMIFKSTTAHLHSKASLRFGLNFDHCICICFCSNKQRENGKSFATESQIPVNMQDKRKAVANNNEVGSFPGVENNAIWLEKFCMSLGAHCTLAKLRLWQQICVKIQCPLRFVLVPKRPNGASWLVWKNVR